MGPATTTLESILSLVDARRHEPITVLGIGGCGGAGKTTLARRLAERVEGAQVVATDEFWTGSSFDLGHLRAAVLDRLLAGSVAEFDSWNWATKTLHPGRRVRPEGLVIVEGVCALHQMFRADLAVRVWVDAPPAVRLERGVARDGEASRVTWETVWMPNEMAYIERDDPVSCAHLVVDGTRPFG
jgi:uridine kinase